MKIIKFKVNKNALEYPTLDNTILNLYNNEQYNFTMINKTISKLVQLDNSSTKSVEEFNNIFGTSEDETLDWNTFNLEYMFNPNYLLTDPSSPYLFIIKILGTVKYGINNITGELEVI